MQSFPVDWSGLDLRGVKLPRMLRGANLKGSDLRDADLRDADLRDADLQGACFVATRFDGARYEKNGVELVFVPGGEYRLGADDVDDDAKPSHRVVLSPYWIGKYPVTNAQYQNLWSGASFFAGESASKLDGPPRDQTTPAHNHQTPTLKARGANLNTPGTRSPCPGSRPRT